MKRLRTILFLGLLIAVCCGSRGKVGAQHLAHYGQYMFNGLVLNPAYAGHKGVLDLGLLSRAQWLGFPGAPRTATFTVHSPSRNLKNNFGAVFSNDRLGPRQSNLFNGIYSYRLFFGKASFSMGLQGGLRLLGTRYDKLGFEDQGDPNIDNPPPTVAVPQAGVGLWLNHPNFYLGISVPEIVRLKTGAYNLHYGNALNYTNYFATAGLMIKIGRDLRIKPSVLVKYTDAVPIQVDINTNLIFKDILVTGFSYRTNGGVVGLMECHFNEQLRLGFSYEMNIQELRSYQSGTAEISLGYSFGYKVKTPDLRYF